MSVSIIRDNAPALAALLEKAALGAVKASCDAMKEACETEVRFRTGALSASFYAVVAGEEEDGYAAAVAEAKGRNEHVVILEKVEAPPGGGVVSAAAGHNEVNEYGGPHIQPKPVMHNVSDAERGRFPARVEKAIAEATK